MPGVESFLTLSALHYHKKQNKQQKLVFVTDTTRHDRAANDLLCKKMIITITLQTTITFNTLLYKIFGNIVIDQLHMSKKFT